MTSEAEVCTILKNSFIAQSHNLYKIPDPSSDYGSTIQRPFDMFGRYKKQPVYMEVKYSNGLKSFNLKEIHDHQYANLLEYSKVENSLCLIALGVKVARGDSRIYIWDVNYIHSRFLEGKNILKKELELLPFYRIKKKLIQEEIIL
jgi:penicillin-binding protein-related factor A (putative recombinase)